MNENIYKDEINQIKAKELFKPRKKVPRNTSNLLACRCSVCDSQKRIKPIENNFTAKEDFANCLGQDQSFTWLLQELGKVSNEHSIKINIPETVIFKKSRPAALIQQKPDRSLKLITSGRSLNIPELRKIIPTLVRSRKNESKEKAESLGKETALVKYLQKGYDNEMEYVSPYQEDGPLRVFKENEFIELLYERAGSPVWKTISYMQGVVKTKTGLNGSFHIKYYSHTINDSLAINELQKAGNMDDEKIEQILMNDEVKYAEFIAKKISYFLAIYSQYEVLRFYPEFIKDDNGKIWLFNASRISVRKIVSQVDSLFKIIHLRNAEKKEELNEEIKISSIDLMVPHQARMDRKMSQHYTSLKENFGINEILREKPKDLTSEQVFKVLRPGTPFSFSQVVSSSVQDRATTDRKSRKNRSSVLVLKSKFVTSRLNPAIEKWINRRVKGKVK